MKRILVLAAALAVVAACKSAQPAELYVPKNTVEFAGNAFTSFSLGADVKIYTAQNPDDKSQWVVQGVVPVRKETGSIIQGLTIDLIPLDDRGIRIRDGFVMHGEDLANMVPVYNAGTGVERTIVFSVSEDGKKKYFSAKEANELISRTKGVRMDFNVTNEEAAAPKVTTEAAKPAEEAMPNTVDGLCRKYGVYGMLSRYDAALRRGDKSGAKRIEDQLWSIERRVMNDYRVPEWLGKAFKNYVEEKEDEIEDRY